MRFNRVTYISIHYPFRLTQYSLVNGGGVTHANSFYVKSSFRQIKNLILVATGASRVSVINPSYFLAN